MIKQLYQQMNEQILPSDTLIIHTKRAIRASSFKKTSPFLKKGYRFGLAACMMIVIAAAALLLQIPNQNIVSPPPTQIIPGPSDTSDNNSSTDSPEQNAQNGNQIVVPIPNDSDSDIKQNNGETVVLLQSQIYEVDGYSDYVPKMFLPGYHFEDATLYQTPERTSLRVNYTSGYNYININVRKLESWDNKRMVDAKNIDSYNITNYAIPLADTVPEHLRETIDNPIFSSEQLSKDVLQFRKFASGEQGVDNGKFTMRFGVLCGDMLVEYSIKGNSLDSVYDMVTSALYFES